MEFDGLFEDHDLDVMANNGVCGLEYIRRGKHLGEDGQFLPDVKSMLAVASQLCALLLHSLRVHKLTEISPKQLKDYERAERFLEAGQNVRELFDPRDWPRQARTFRAIIKDILAGKRSLSEDEIGEQQHFLYITSCVLLESIHSQQRVFMDARGIHYI